MAKVAVVLLNLGGPDSKNAVEPFLRNFFMDPNILRIPIPFRCILAWLISKRRSRKEAKDAYDLIGGYSPLLDNTTAQAKALQKILSQAKDHKFKTFVCMRYWHPMSDQVVREVRAWKADQIILLPLYPQFSTTTTWSSLGVWKKAMQVADFDRPANVVCCYPKNEGYVEASAENVKAIYEQAVKDGHKSPRILFSAHGLPENVITDGDPYQWQCEQSAEQIVKALKIKNLDWQVCYQSRVGPMKWIGPSTEEALEKAAQDQKAVVVYPHAFTQEHVETLAEIELEYRHMAEKMDVPGFYRVPTVSTHPDFIQGLADLVLNRVDQTGVQADGGACICPEQFNRCCMRAG